jgi:Tol biopolymer transport system component
MALNNLKEGLPSISTTQEFPAVGDVVLSANALPAPEYLVANRAAYLQQSFQKLFSVIGLQANKFFTQATLGSAIDGTPTGQQFSSDGRYHVVGGLGPSGDTARIYKRTTNITYSMLNDFFAAGSITGATITKDGSHFAFCNNSEPIASVYRRNANDTFTQLTLPFLPTGTNGVAIALSPSGRYLALASFGSPRICIYVRDGDTFTKIFPDTDAPAEIVSMAWSRDEKNLVFITTNSVYAYTVVGNTFTRTSTLASNFDASSHQVALSHDYRFIAVATTGTEKVAMYKNRLGLAGNDWFKLPAVDVVPTATCRGVSLNPDGSVMIVTQDTSPYARVYRRTGERFFLDTSISGLTLSMSGQGLKVANSADGLFTSIGEYNAGPALRIVKNFNYDETASFVLPDVQKETDTTNTTPYIKAL